MLSTMMSPTCGAKQIYVEVFLAAKSTGDGAVVMVDEFSRKMKGCCDGLESGEREEL
jgi:uncharacterized protein YbbK (DUF523 family)